jgi:hypothetical protein
MLECRTPIRRSPAVSRNISDQSGGAAPRRPVTSTGNSTVTDPGGPLLSCVTASSRAFGRTTVRTPAIEAVRGFAEEIGALPADTRGAVEGADVVILSIPFPAVADLPKDLFTNLPPSVPVVDTNNHYPGLRDPQIPEVDAG